MFEQSHQVDQEARAELFATLMAEETGTGRHHRRPAEADDELTTLVGLANRLGTLPQPTVREDFREQLRLRLLNAYQQDGFGHVPGQRGSVRLVAVPDVPVVEATPPVDTSVGPTQVVPVFRPRRTSRARLAAVIGVASGALVLSGVSVASNGATPGDPLYSVKQASEQAQLVMAGSDANRGHLHLDFARVRLAEAGQVTPDAVGGVLAKMDQETTEGARLLFTAGMQHADADTIGSVLTFISQQRSDLLDLRATAAAPDDPARHSLDLLDSIEIRANELRAAIADHCTSTTTDQFGPKPAC
jgi:hypothetical protein